jgi:hypothetical protein
MIAVPIAALSFALANVVAEPGSMRPTTDPVVSNTAVAPVAAAFPGLSFPKVPMPRFRLPHLPKRSGDSEALEATARRLTAMVAQQESWYSDHGQYRSNAAGLPAGAASKAPQDPNVQVQVLFANRKGWTAIASHPDAPGKSCVIYVGVRSAIPIIPRTRADAAEAAAEAKPVCDR